MQINLLQRVFSILLLCCFFIVNVATAQTPQYSFMGGTSSNSFPMNSSTNRVQWVYVPTDLNAPSGTITRIYIRPSTTTNSTYGNWTIAMGHTNITNFTSGAFLTGVSTVYYASSITIPTTTDQWVAVDLQTPFSYDNTQSLIVDISQTSYVPSGMSMRQETTNGSGKRLYGTISSGTGTAGTGLLNFGMDLITCNAPTGVTASNITVAGATMTWNPVSGSLGYEYKIDQVATGPTSGWTFTSGTSMNVSNLNLNTSYYFHVRNICANGPSQWVNIPFTTLDAYCRRPTQLLFSNITGTSADVHWSQMPTTDWYQYMLDVTPNAQNNLSNSVTTTGITANFSNLTPDTWYFVYVRSFCLNGSDSSIWMIDSFYTSNFCPAPDVKLPNLTNTAVTADWDPIPNAVEYEYVVTNSSSDPSFGMAVAGGPISLTLTDDGKPKYLHVRTKCNSMFTFSDWTTNQLKGTGVKQVSTNNGISVYPNPLGDMLNIKFGSAYNDGILQLLDVSGKVLSTIEVHPPSMSMNTEHLNPGIYFLKYTGSSSQQVIRLVK